MCTLYFDPLLQQSWNESICELLTEERFSRSLMEEKQAENPTQIILPRFRYEISIKDREPFPK
jgi:hypothetical protein